ncbi:RNA polymerase sigma factor SigE [Mycobacterium lepromatosis]|nr:RNA polymerase sigma factor SigE [Mycobacterium lepromatosis]
MHREFCCAALFTLWFLRQTSVCSYIAHTPMGDGIGMEREERWTGNTQCQLRVVPGDESFILDGRATPEDLIITNLSSPTIMHHPPPSRDDDWVESFDALQGTAVFDATGDKATMPSWEELVRQHAARVYWLAYRLSGNQYDAEDLTQETFIRVFRSVQNYRPGTFEGWLHRITTNLFLDMVRRRARIRMDALPDDYERVPADESNPEQIYHDSRLGPDLQAALDSLPPEFRAAVVLCDIEGLSYEEIGATLGVKLGTVRSRIHRGRQALRDYLTAHPGNGAATNATQVKSALSPHPPKTSFGGAQKAPAGPT